MGGRVAFLVSSGNLGGVFGGVLAPLETENANPVAGLASVEVEQTSPAVFAAGLVVLAIRQRCLCHRFPRVCLGHRSLPCRSTRTGMLWSCIEESK